jgi:anti-sigma factor RsiW
MSERGEHDRQEREAKINALLDGELDAADAQALEAAASADRGLARDIIEAYQLQQAMDQLRPEAAPASLRRRLRRIPREHRRRPWLFEPRWAAALATVPLLAAGLMLLRPQGPSRAEVEQAAAELAIALAYIEQVSDRAAGRIEQEVGGEIQKAVAGSVIRSIPRFQIETKETQA